MSQSRVKKIRRTVYGDYSPKFRKYKRLPNGSLTGQIIADDRRRDYQKAKKWRGKARRGGAGNI